MIKFLYSNPFDSATVTALNTASGFSAANVQTRLLKQTYRSTGLSNQWLKFDLGAATAVSLFTFFANNFTTGATVKLYGHASNLGNLESDWSVASYKATITDFDQHAGYVSLSQTLRWWLFTVTDASNGDGYIELGRVVGGTSVSPTENFSEDIEENLIDPSEQLWSTGGHVYSTERERYKEFVFSFRDISSANQDTLRALWNTVYKTEPFVIAFDPTSEPVELTRYGVLTSDLRFAFSANNRATCTLNFRELR